MQADQYEIMFRAEETHWWYRALHRLIFASLQIHLPEWSNKTILDAGCGTGGILKQLGNPEKNRGIDLSADAIAFCQQRGLENVSRGDITALPFQEGAFDAAICSSVLYHEWVPDVNVALAELYRVLRPGGLLLVNLPAHQFLRSPHDVAVQTARRFTRKQGDAMLERNGFTVLRSTGWTTLLFPLAVAARTMGVGSQGHDFSAVDRRSSLKNKLLDAVMDLELAILQRVSLPFGVGLFLVARKQSHRQIH